jgi:hypothetical protein
MSKLKQNSPDIEELANKVARNSIAMIDALTQRGAFKGEELSTIGSLREASTHLIALVEANAVEDDESEG